MLKNSKWPLLIFLSSSLSYFAVSELLTRRYRQKQAAATSLSNETRNTSILGNSLSEYLRRIAIKQDEKQPKDEDHHIHIVGGGISGLLIGFVCKEMKIPFTIYEASEQSCGGLLGSERITFSASNENEEWMIAEKAANGVMWTEQVQQLCERIGLMKQVISTKSEAKARFFVKNGKLTQFPISFMGVFNVLVWRMWKLPLFWKRESNNSNNIFETLDEYFEFYFGGEITKQFLEPAFAGIFGTTLNNLSLYGTNELFPKLLHHSLSFPISVIKNLIGEVLSGLFSSGKKPQQQITKRKGTHSFKFGMQELIDHLVNHVGSENIKLGYNVVELSQFNNNKKNGRIVLTTPAYQTVNILKRSTITSNSGDNEDESSKLIELLSNIRYTPIAICTVIVEREKCPKLKKGFGCLIPRNEGLNILGVLFNSSIFENRVSHDDRFASLTCIMQDDGALSDQQLLENVIVKELSTLFMLNNSTTETTTTINESIVIVAHSMKRWKCGIPVYDHHLYQSWNLIHNILKQELPNVNLFGNYTGQISIRGMIGQAVDLLNDLEERTTL